MVGVCPLNFLGTKIGGHQHHGLNRHGVHKKGREVTFQTQILFVLQEALTNIYKHANAQTISIVIEQEDAFEMSVQDDGCGFDASVLEQDGHIGLKIMQERAKQIGAQLQITSSAEQGTTLELTYPI